MVGSMTESNGSGRDRSRPGRRALFSEVGGDGGTSGREPPAGRRALFSDEVVEAAGRRDTTSPGGRTAVVRCRTCLEATPVSLVSLGLALMPSLWLPTRPWPRLMRCPACHRVSWCRIDWPSLR
jgi:hypothetical protein